MDPLYNVCALQVWQQWGSRRLSHAAAAASVVAACSDLNHTLTEWVNGSAGIVAAGHSGTIPIVHHAPHMQLCKPLPVGGQHRQGEGQGRAVGYSKRRK